MTYFSDLPFMNLLRFFFLFLLLSLGSAPSWVPHWFDANYAWAVNPDDDDGNNEDDSSSDGSDGEDGDDDGCGDGGGDNGDGDNPDDPNDDECPEDDSNDNESNDDGDESECSDSPIALPTKGEKVDLHILFDQHADELRPFTFGPGARLSMLHELKMKGVNGVPNSRAYIWWANWTKTDHGSVLYEKKMKKQQVISAEPAGGDADGGEVTIEPEYEWVVTNHDMYRPGGKGNGGFVSESNDDYVYFDKTGNQYIFSNHFFDDENFYRLTRFIDLNGNAIFYNYSGDNLLTITDASFNQYIVEANYEHTYESSSGNVDLKLISKITTIPAGQTALSKSWSYDYDESGRLKSETFNELVAEEGYGVLGFKLNENNVKVQTTDFKGYVTDIDYDQDSQNKWYRKEKVLKNGEKITFSRTDTDEGYDKFIRYPDGRMKISSFQRLRIGDYKVKEVMPNGLEITYDRDNKGNVVKKTEISSDNTLVRVSEFKYDADNRLIEKKLDATGQGQIFQYSYTNGFKTSEVDPLGNEKRWVYDTKGNLLKYQKVSSGDIIEVQYEYNTFGNITKKIDELGYETLFEYNDLGQLIKRTDRRGFETTYTYDIWGNLETETNARGAVTTYGYDLLNRKTSVTDPLGFTESYEFDENDNKIQVTDKKGIVTNYDFNELDQNIKVYGNDTVGMGSCSSCGGTSVNGKEGDYVYRWDGLLLSYTDLNNTITAYDYDLNNKLVAKSIVGTDVDKLVQFENDELGRRTKEIHVNPQGLDYVISYEYNLLDLLVSKSRGVGEEAIMETYQYDDRNLMTQKTDPKGYVYQYSYDGFSRRVSEINPQGLVKEHVYNDRNEITKTTVDPSGFAYVTTYSYNEEGGLISMTRPDSSTIQTMFDEVGNRVKTIDPLNDEIAFELNLKNEIVKTTDAGGYVTIFSYDELGKRVSTTNHLGRVDIFEYDDKSFMINQKEDLNGIGRFTQHSRDEFLNLVGTVDASGLEVDYEYDSLHRRIKVIEDPDGVGIETTFHYDDINNLISDTDAAGFQTINVYDQLKRLVKKVKPDGGQTEYVYDDNSNLIEKIEKVNGSTNLITTYEYDELNRVVKEIENSGELNITTTRTYDILGRLESLTDSKGNTTSYQYDSMNRVVLETYADGGNIQKSYDLKGRLKTRVDQNGSSCSYIYNSRNLLVQKNYGPNGIQTFTYDELGRLVQSTDNNDGDATVICDFTFDALHRKTDEIQTIGAVNPQTIHRTFDAFGHELTCEHTSGRVVSKTYTKFHQVDQIIDVSSGTVLVDYNYEYDSNLDGDKRKIVETKALASSTNIISNVEYDELGRVTQMSWTQNSDTLVGFAHQYDLYGNRTSDTHLHNPSDSETYSYDSAQRFDAYERQDGFAQSWQLDDLGNWSSFDNNGSVETRTHNATNEIVSSSVYGATTHDDNGNMTFHDGKQFVWDTNNRLREVYRTSGNGAIAKYYYNAMNLRVRKDIDTDADGLLDDTTLYYYCGQKVCEERGGNNNFKRDYVHGGQFIDEVIMASDVARAIGTFSLTDLRYSVYAVVDADGSVLERYTYDPYGERTVVGASESAVGQEFGYTGRRHDVEGTGLMYFRARYYSGELGRFVSRDPSGFSDGMNLYGGHFVVIGMDPSGMIVLLPGIPYGLDTPNPNQSKNSSPYSGPCLGNAYTLDGSCAFGPDFSANPPSGGGQKSCGSKGSGGRGGSAGSTGSAGGAGSGSAGVGSLGSGISPISSSSNRRQNRIRGYECFRCYNTYNRNYADNIKSLKSCVLASGVAISESALLSAAAGAVATKNAYVAGAAGLAGGGIAAIGSLGPASQCIYQYYRGHQLNNQILESCLKQCDK